MLFIYKITISEKNSIAKINVTLFLLIVNFEYVSLLFVKLSYNIWAKNAFLDLQWR